MIFEYHTLSSILSNNVEAIFYFKDFMPDHSKERVVPTGHVFLIFELDGFIRNTFDNSTLEPLKEFRRVWISGMQQQYLTISAHEKSEMLVVQFKAHGLRPFLDGDVADLNETVWPAEEILGQEILRLHASLFSTQAPVEKFELVENYLCSRQIVDMEAPKEVIDVLSAMQKEPLSSLANHVHNYPHSAQYLIKQFKKYVGLTPKYYLRILRFNEILQKIKHQEKLIWTDIAYQCGYSDQSHFIKEFKHFSGFNPSEFIHKSFQKDTVNFFPLDRDDEK